MLSHRRNAPPTIILDSRVIAGVAAGALALAVFSFFLGRWSAGGASVAEGEAAVGPGESPPIEVRQSSIEDDLSFLNRVERDRLEGIAAAEARTEPAPAPREEPVRAAAASVPSPGVAANSPPSRPPRREPQASGSSAPSLAADRSGYLIQVFASEHLDRAEAKRDELAGKGYPVAVVTTQRDSKTYYRVRVGPYADKSRALSIKGRLEREEGLSTWIIKKP